MNALKEKLDVTERSKFRKLESIVAEGMSSFVAVGEALKEIRDGKLYREAFKTFEKYVDQKWGIERRRAYQLIDASEAKANLCKILHKNETANAINTESQLRELKYVPNDSMEAVVEKAAELAGDGKITASDLKQARQEVLGEVTATTTTQEPLQFEDVDDEPAPPAKPEKDTPAELAAHINAIGTRIDSILKDLKALAEVPGGEWLDMATIETNGKAWKFEIKQAAFWRTCMSCNGKGCRTCKQHGWLSLTRKQFLSQEEKDLAGL